MRRRRVVGAVGNSQAAAEVDVLDAMAVGAQASHQIGEQRKGVPEWRELSDLAADVHIDAGDREARQLRSPRIDRARGADRNAELVRRLAGRNLLMGLGIHIGIDADRDARGRSLGRGDR